ncbi:hypothetical protein BLNAU_4463 [Blattamonas nauphoetae]|uniref:Uncharacterized protein n=1 Tax=Blattamonas nauphoetae TaxID=2049346 RepID=A0ABQ9Y9Z1_9EUKA|nr:hypothetical protein BLNAU_4463 [Blattamonas nauphoetae]
MTLVTLLLTIFVFIALYWIVYALANEIPHYIVQVFLRSLKEHSKTMTLQFKNLTFSRIEGLKVEFDVEDIRTKITVDTVTLPFSTKEVLVMILSQLLGRKLKIDPNIFIINPRISISKIDQSDLEETESFDKSDSSPITESLTEQPPVTISTYLTQTFVTPIARKLGAVIFPEIVSDTPGSLATVLMNSFSYHITKPEIVIVDETQNTRDCLAFTSSELFIGLQKLNQKERSSLLVSSGSVFEDSEFSHQAMIQTQNALVRVGFEQQIGKKLRTSFFTFSSHKDVQSSIDLSLLYKLKSSSTINEDKVDSGEPVQSDQSFDDQFVQTQNKDKYEDKLGFSVALCEGQLHHIVGTFETQQSSVKSLSTFGTHSITSGSIWGQEERINNRVIVKESTKQLSQNDDDPKDESESESDSNSEDLDEPHQTEIRAPTVFDYCSSTKPSFLIGHLGFSILHPQHNRNSHTVQSDSDQTLLDEIAVEEGRTPSDLSKHQGTSTNAKSILHIHAIVDHFAFFPNGLQSNALQTSIQSKVRDAPNCASIITNNPNTIQPPFVDPFSLTVDTCTNPEHSDNIHQSFNTETISDLNILFNTLESDQFSESIVAIEKIQIRASSWISSQINDPQPFSNTFSLALSTSPLYIGINTADIINPQFTNTLDGLTSILAMSSPSLNMYRLSSCHIAIQSIQLRIHDENQTIKFTIEHVDIEITSGNAKDILDAETLIETRDRLVHDFVSQTVTPSKAHNISLDGIYARHLAFSTGQIDLFIHRTVPASSSVQLLSTPSLFLASFTSTPSNLASTHQSIPHQSLLPFLPISSHAEHSFFLSQVVSKITVSDSLALTGSFYDFLSILSVSQKMVSFIDTLSTPNTTRKSSVITSHSLMLNLPRLSFSLLPSNTENPLHGQVQFTSKDVSLEISLLPVLRLEGKTPSHSPMQVAAISNEHSLSSVSISFKSGFKMTNEANESLLEIDSLNIKRTKVVRSESGILRQKAATTHIPIDLNIQQGIIVTLGDLALLLKKDSLQTLINAITESVNSTQFEAPTHSVFNETITLNTKELAFSMETPTNEELTVLSDSFSIQVDPQNVIKTVPAISLTNMSVTFCEKLIMRGQSLKINTQSTTFSPPTATQGKNAHPLFLTVPSALSEFFDRSPPQTFHVPPFISLSSTPTVVEWKEFVVENPTQQPVKSKQKPVKATKSPKKSPKKKPLSEEKEKVDEPSEKQEPVTEESIEDYLDIRTLKKDEAERLLSKLPVTFSHSYIASSVNARSSTATSTPQITRAVHVTDKPHLLPGLSVNLFNVHSQKFKIVLVTPQTKLDTDELDTTFYTSLAKREFEESYGPASFPRLLSVPQLRGIGDDDQVDENSTQKLQLPSFDLEDVENVSDDENQEEMDDDVEAQLQNLMKLSATLKGSQKGISEEVSMKLSQLRKLRQLSKERRAERTRHSIQVREEHSRITSEQQTEISAFREREQTALQKLTADAERLRQRELLRQKSISRERETIAITQKLAQLRESRQIGDGATAGVPEFETERQQLSDKFGIEWTIPTTQQPVVIPTEWKAIDDCNAFVSSLGASSIVEPDALTVTLNQVELFLPSEAQDELVSQPVVIEGSDKVVGPVRFLEQEPSFQSRVENFADYLIELKIKMNTISAQTSKTQIRSPKNTTFLHPIIIKSTNSSITLLGGQFQQTLLQSRAARLATLTLADYVLKKKSKHRAENEVKLFTFIENTISTKQEEFIGHPIARVGAEEFGFVLNNPTVSSATTCQTGEVSVTGVSLDSSTISLTTLFAASNLNVDFSIVQNPQDDSGLLVDSLSIKGDLPVLSFSEESYAQILLISQLSTNLAKRYGLSAFVLGSATRSFRFSPKNVQVSVTNSALFLAAGRSRHNISSRHIYTIDKSNIIIHPSALLFSLKSLRFTKSETTFSLHSTQISLNITEKDPEVALLEYINSTNASVVSLYSSRVAIPTLHVDRTGSSKYRIRLDSNENSSPANPFFSLSVNMISFILHTISDHLNAVQTTKKFTQFLKTTSCQEFADDMSLSLQVPNLDGTIVSSEAFLTRDNRTDMQIETDSVAPFRFILSAQGVTYACSVEPTNMSFAGSSAAVEHIGFALSNPTVHSSKKVVLLPLSTTNEELLGMFEYLSEEEIFTVSSITSISARLPNADEGKESSLSIESSDFSFTTLTLKCCYVLVESLYMVASSAFGQTVTNVAIIRKTCPNKYNLAETTQTPTFSFTHTKNIRLDIFDTPKSALSLVLPPTVVTKSSLHTLLVDKEHNIGSRITVAFNGGTHLEHVRVNNAKQSRLTIILIPTRQTVSWISLSQYARSVEPSERQLVFTKPVSQPMTTVQIMIPSAAMDNGFPERTIEAMKMVTSIVKVIDEETTPYGQAQIRSALPLPSSTLPTVIRKAILESAAASALDLDDEDTLTDEELFALNEQKHLLIPAMQLSLIMNQGLAGEEHRFAIRCNIALLKKFQEHLLRQMDDDDDEDEEEDGDDDDSAQEDFLNNLTVNELVGELNKLSTQTFRFLSAQRSLTEYIALLDRRNTTEQTKNEGNADIDVEPVIESSPDNGEGVTEMKDATAPRTCITVCVGEFALASLPSNVTSTEQHQDTLKTTADNKTLFSAQLKAIRMGVAFTRGLTTVVGLKTGEIDVRESSRDTPQNPSQSQDRTPTPSMTHNSHGHIVRVVDKEKQVQVEDEESEVFEKEINASHFVNDEIDHTLFRFFHTPSGAEQIDHSVGILQQAIDTIIDANSFFFCGSSESFRTSPHLTLNVVLPTTKLGVYGQEIPIIERFNFSFSNLNVHLSNRILRRIKKTFYHLFAPWRFELDTLRKSFNAKKKDVMAKLHHTNPVPLKSRRTYRTVGSTEKPIVSAVPVFLPKFKSRVTMNGLVQQAENPNEKSDNSQDNATNSNHSDEDNFGVVSQTSNKKSSKQSPKQTPKTSPAASPSMSSTAPKPFSSESPSTIPQSSPLEEDPFEEFLNLPSDSENEIDDIADMILNGESRDSTELRTMFEEITRIKMEKRRSSRLYIAKSRCDMSNVIFSKSRSVGTEEDLAVQSAASTKKPLFIERTEVLPTTINVSGSLVEYVDMIVTPLQMTMLFQTDIVDLAAALEKKAIRKEIKARRALLKAQAKEDESVVVPSIEDIRETINKERRQHFTINAGDLISPITITESGITVVPYDRNAPSITEDLERKMGISRLASSSRPETSSGRLNPPLSTHLLNDDDDDNSSSLEHIAPTEQSNTEFDLSDFLQVLPEDELLFDETDVLTDLEHSVIKISREAIDARRRKKAGRSSTKKQSSAFSERDVEQLLSETVNALKVARIQADLE